MKKIINTLFLALSVLLILGTLAYQILTAPRGNYDELVYRYAEQYQLEPALVLAVIKAESNFDAEARSPKEAYGLMQITEETLHWAQLREGDQVLYSADALYRPEINIKYGCCILSLLSDEFKDRNTVLAAYNAGRGNVLKWLKDSRYSDGSVILTTPFDETNQYIKKVNKYYQSYQKSGGKS